MVNLKKLKDQYLKLLKSNQKSKNGYRYTVPSSSLYPYQWFWDSCFHSIIYTQLGDFDYAKDEIRSLIAGQWTNGMIPHMIYWEKPTIHDQEWGTSKNTSSITQPPMIAYSVEKLFNTTEDISFVEEVFDQLDAYYKWLHKDRSNSYLLSIIHPWESGKDDFVPWDTVMNLCKPKKEEHEEYKLYLLKEYVKTGLDSKKFLEKDLFNVKSLLFNCIYLRNLKSMLALAKIVEKEEKYYQNMIKNVEKACKKHLYNEDLDIYSTFYSDNTCIQDVDNPSVFMPLFAGLSTKEEANRLVKKILLDEDTFWTSYPIPTISIDNDNFEPNRYWRGSTWVNINWFIYKGLLDYGFDQVAKRLKDKTIRMIEKGGFHEYFNSINGKGRGPGDFCWSGLIFDM